MSLWKEIKIKDFNLKRKKKKRKFFSAIKKTRLNASNDENSCTRFALNEKYFSLKIEIISLTFFIFPCLKEIFKH